jgi:hypothetical protein
LAPIPDAAWVSVPVVQDVEGVAILTQRRKRITLQSQIFAVIGGLRYWRTEDEIVTPH